MEVFYREHLEAVRHFVARRVADPHLAADLTAEIFLAAVDAASSYRPDRGIPAAWLIGVARHVVATEFRRQSRERAVVSRISGRRLLDADSLARIEERIDAQRASRTLYAALASLPRRDRALCPQATHHPEHRPVWAEHAQNITSVFLGNPRLSKPEQARARAAFDRAQRVLAEINTADADLDQDAAHADIGQDVDHGQ